VRSRFHLVCSHLLDSLSLIRQCSYVAVSDGDVSSQNSALRDAVIVSQPEPSRQ
jgi:hypothetical protein